ncbi:MAG TPA: aminotransferase class III-fold pyridoxal phosphate-dependent enzyme [Actinomycetota bacterium]|nr:aminotransferase class III-fold pyridoxal phosphate-dependent enzyme [Actinomycetota bacterium]
MGALWHPFSDLAQVEREGELVIERGEGVHVWDEAGRRYLDATASLWYCNVGYGREEIVRAAAAQMRSLPAYSTFGDLATRPALELAERVAALAPVPGSLVFLTSGGSDSVDTAAKIARRYWQLLGRTERTVLVHRSRSYHGMHLGGTSLAGIPANAEGYGTLLADVLEVPWDSAEALREAIGRVGEERVAAFFCEPVIGAGGVFPPPEGYLKEARRICREAGALFVADEVITGFGRCGAWFASSRFELEPDLVTCAKGLTSGYLPAGAVLVAPWVAEPFRRPDAGMFRHGYTYSGHAAAAAAALANLAIMEREDLPARALRLEEELAEALAPLAGHELVREVRAGTGVLAAVQLRVDLDGSLPARAVRACREAGILTRALATGALQVSPALTIGEAELRELADGLRAALDSLA